MTERENGPSEGCGTTLAMPRPQSLRHQPISNRDLVAHNRSSVNSRDLKAWPRQTTLQELTKMYCIPFSLTESAVMKIVCKTFDD